MTTLTEYRAAIESAESGKSEYPREAFGVMCNEIKTALWQPGHKEDALELQARAEWLAYDPSSPVAD